MPTKPGDPCPCGHYLIVVNSKLVGDTRVQYVGCRRCGYRPVGNKVVVPLKVSSTGDPPEPTTLAYDGTTKHASASESEEGHGRRNTHLQRAAATLESFPAKLTAADRGEPDSPAARKTRRSRPTTRSVSTIGAPVVRLTRSF